MCRTLKQEETALTRGEWGAAGEIRVSLQEVGNVCGGRGEKRERVRESRLQVGVRENVLICRTGSLLGPRERVHLHKEPRSILGGEQ